MDVLRDILVEIGAALFTALLLSAGAVLVTPHIADRIARLNPTCEKAQGLRPLAPDELSASGPSRSKHYAATSAVDGDAGTVWVPPLRNLEDPTLKGFSPWVPVFFGTEQLSTLTLTFKKPHDVSLVCVNNGFGAGDTRYENFGKVRTTMTWGDQGSAKVTAILSSFPVEDSDMLQRADADLGKVTSVHIRLIDAYAGRDVLTYDPDQCGKRTSGDSKYKVDEDGVQHLYSAGCILSASPKAGLSEVAVYSSDGT